MAGLVSLALFCSPGIRLLQVLPAGVSFAHLPETYSAKLSPGWGHLSSWRASAFGLKGFGLYIDGEPDRDEVPWDSAMAPTVKGEGAGR